jgi:hypothetical protein
MEEPVPPDERQPMLTKEQQEDISRAATEALANLAMVLQPIIAQFRALAVVALPALNEAIKPFSQALKDAGLDRLNSGELEAMVRGEALADQMAVGADCRRCDPPRRVAAGYMLYHLRDVHSGRTAK